jgi:hypothetical protein
MNYDALTIDTQAVEANGFHFDGGLLHQLKQFSNGRVEVVISQVVASEIARHLREKTQAAKDALEKAHGKAQQFGLRNPEDMAFAEPPDARVLSLKRLTQFFRDIGATLISPDDVPMRDLWQSYVQAAPPFAGSGKKKNEFPDAIALMSLEFWAKKHNKRLLAVSGDPDWASFGAKSTHIDVLPNLSDALVKLQEGAEQAEVFVERTLMTIKNGGNVELRERFERLLNDEISGASVYAQAESSYALEDEDVQLSLEHYEFEDEDGAFNPQIVRFGRTIVVAGISLRAFVAATATFSVSIYDTVDKDYVSFGSTTVEKNDEELDITVLVTFEGDFVADKTELTKVELTGGGISIDFGMVEPDYSDPDYDDFVGEGNADLDLEQNLTEEEQF